MNVKVKNLSRINLFYVRRMDNMFGDFNATTGGITGNDVSAKLLTT